MISGPAGRDRESDLGWNVDTLVVNQAWLNVSEADRPSFYRVFALLHVLRVSFLEDQDVTLVSLGEHDDKRNKSWAPVGEEIVLAALERIVDSAHYPVLITCNTGKHRTGEKPRLPSW